MREYKLPATFFTKTLTRILVWPLLISVIALAAGIRLAMAVIALFINESEVPALVLFITIIVALIALIIGTLAGLRRLQRSWASYRLTLDDDSIRRVQDGYPEVTIHSSEISRITETEERGLVVHSMRPYTYIGIPRAMEDYSEIRSDLARRHAIESISRTWEKLMTVLTISSGLLTLVALLITFLATNKYLVVVTGILLFVWLLVSAAIIQRSGSASRQSKRNVWFMLLPLLAIVARVLFVATNW